MSIINSKVEAKGWIASKIAGKRKRQVFKDKFSQGNTTKVFTDWLEIIEKCFEQKARQREIKFSHVKFYVWVVFNMNILYKTYNLNRSLKCELRLLNEFTLHIIWYYVS